MNRPLQWTDHAVFRLRQRYGVSDFWERTQVLAMFDDPRFYRAIPDRKGDPTIESRRIIFGDHDPVVIDAVVSTKANHIITVKYPPHLYNIAKQSRFLNGRGTVKPRYLPKLSRMYARPLGQDVRDVMDFEFDDDNYSA